MIKAKPHPVCIPTNATHGFLPSRPGTHEGFVYIFHCPNDHAFTNSWRMCNMSVLTTSFAYAVLHIAIYIR